MSLQPRRSKSGMPLSDDLLKTLAERGLSRTEIERVEREAALRHALSALVRAYDAPPDGTGFARERAAIVEARKLLGMAPVYGVDGEPA